MGPISMTKRGHAACDHERDGKGLAFIFQRSLRSFLIEGLHLLLVSFPLVGNPFSGKRL